ncbi:FAD-binding oxidoreductase [Saccharopolyspora indica]|uniref:NAD(P)/FAD-dependent oxidoreductase n=1 Tax=Saccharopolyspora indica TaxID=1229659 RepID=UPI0022EA12F8|nr:FAD-binding oxidoreductase [Saccharopolyspora indica]MDA3648625.1 FAD-binding oxidoreductase [Saccharopolyspora indica]
MARKIVVIGGGIVGSSIAALLPDDVSVTVLDRGPVGPLAGSTGLAPGFVGLLNEVPVLTELARASAELYDDLELDGTRGFERIGGVEVAGSPEAAEKLTARAELAAAAGLPHRLLDAAEAVALAPGLINPEHCHRGLHLTSDGAARPDILTAALRKRSNARFVQDAAVVGIELSGNRATAVRTETETYPADDVVLAGGIWGPQIAALVDVQLPLTAFAHPYVYGPEGASAPTAPFVRWPEHQVYVRHHGGRLGLGTYNHAIQPVPQDDLGTSAEKPWPGEVFDEAVHRAMRLLPTPFDPAERLNGMFAVTPDNLPFLGPIPSVEGLWSAVAIWVTSAGGAAQALVDQLLDKTPRFPDLNTLAPTRFEGQNPKHLQTRAHHLYNDTYASL